MRWVRLITTGDDARCLSTDVIEICRPEGLGDIANLGLTLPEAKQLLASVRVWAGRQPWAAAAVLPGLQRKMPPEGPAATPHQAAVWRSDCAASSVSMHRLQSHRDERWLAIALPIDT
jgi:hypothetical protein